MSSDVQRYSTENQQNAIAEYAQRHGYRIVASYRDAGKSGLTLKGRTALRQLLSDALRAERPFDAILVLDVSRWGRFQDPDQAGHYEFLCRQAGVPIVYCAEPFGNDVAPATTIIKHLKRVMAGEYSRELSAKVRRAHYQQALLGFRQGGSLTYGFRRLLVDASRNPRQVLSSGERKALSTDKVVIVPGPPEELAVIKRIFRFYVDHRLSIAETTRRISTEISGSGGRPLGYRTVRHILSSELCIGQMTYRTTTSELQAPRKRSPKEQWARFSAFEPVVPVSQFRKAQDRLSQPRVQWDKGSITVALQTLLSTMGRLSQRLINQADNGLCYERVVDQFGSLDAAYAAVGYVPTADRWLGVNGKYWSDKAILAGLRKLHSIHGSVSNRLIDEFADLPSAALIRRRFGSLSKAIGQAGLPVCSHSQTQIRVWQRRRETGCEEIYLGVRWSNEKLARALRKLYEENGYTTRNLIDQSDTSPSAHYYIRRFGSLDEARRVARIPVLTHSQRMSAACKRRRDGTTTIRRQRRRSGQRVGLHYRSDDILIGLKHLAKKTGVISARLINADPALPSAACIINHFGSLREAYKRAGIVQLEGSLVRFGWPPRKVRRKKS